jgi:hypothetical protein
MRYVKRIWNDCITEVVEDLLIASIFAVTSGIAVAVVIWPLAP